MKALSTLCILLLCCSCSNNAEETTGSIPKDSIEITEEQITDTITVLETYIDSTTIGKPGHNKIELNYYLRSGNGYVSIRLHTRSTANWEIRQSFEFSKSGFQGCDMSIADFNNDGFKDMTYISMDAVRGANEVRKLFIYNDNNDSLTYIRNSEDYPNMLYNSELDCIDAFLVHGSSSTIFLKIYIDSLAAFARVHNDNIRSVYIYNNSGKETLLHSEVNTEGAYYVRFKNYNPLITY